MYDNITIDPHGRLFLQEDVGNAVHNGKIWMYEIATDALTQIAMHDPARFGDVNTPATSPFNQDEESSGIIDASQIFGMGFYLLDVQAHYAINAANPHGFSNPNELVEGGQLMLLHVPMGVGPRNKKGRKEPEEGGADRVPADGHVAGWRAFARAFDATLPGRQDQ